MKHEIEDDMVEVPPDPSAPLPVWSRRLRELRTIRGWSQQELGDRAEPSIAVATISTIERGGHSGTDTLERLAKALEVSLALFFTEDTEGVLTPTQSSDLITRIVRCATEAVEDYQRRAPTK